MSGITVIWSDNFNTFLDEFLRHRVALKHKKSYFLRNLSAKPVQVYIFLYILRRHSHHNSLDIFKHEVALVNNYYAKYLTVIKLKTISHISLGTSEA